MNTRPFTHPRRPAICATSIALFLAASNPGPAVTHQVDLGDTFTEGGLLTSNTGLVKTGLGTLFLTNNANSYTGPTTINAGSVVITNVGALGASSSLTINGSNTLASTSGQLVLGGGYVPQTFNFASFGGLAVSGGGPGGLAGALVSVGNNTISGGIATSSTVSTLLVSTFGIASVPALTIGANRFTQLFGKGHWALSGLSGTGTLQMQGSGTLVLTGTNLNSGSLDLNVGFVRVSFAANLGTSTAANAISLNAGTLEARTEAPDFSGKKVAFSTTNISGTIVADRAVGGSGLNQTVAFSDLLLLPNRTLNISTRNGYGVSFTGASGTIGGGGAGPNIFNSNGNGPLTLAANVWNNNDGTARALTFSGTGDTLVTGSILAPGSAAHSVIKSGTGTLTIEGDASTYKGTTDIGAGTVNIRSLGAFGDPIANTAPIRLGTGANNVVLNFLGAAGAGAGGSTPRPIQLAGTSGGGRINANQAGSSPSPLVIAGSVTSPTAGLKTLTLGGASNLDNEIGGAISNGSGMVALTKADAGTWVLSGANTYTGSTTITQGALKLRANAAASTILADASPIIFNVEASTQSAGGTLEFAGLPGMASLELLGALVPTAGAGTVRVTPGPGGQASLGFASLAGSATAGASVNFVAPTALDSITLGGVPSGFIRAQTYFNGSNFAYSQSGALRAPIYGTDPGFITSASALTLGAHQQITDSFSSGTTTVGSLKIVGSQTLTLTGVLGIRAEPDIGGGILQTGGSGTIAGTGVTLGSGTAAGNPGAFVIRVDDASDTLILAAPITAGNLSGLTKNGAGTLILSALNAQVGTTNIDEGTVRLAGSGRLSASSQPLNLRQGATLDLNGVSTGTAIGLFNGAGTVTNTGSGAATLTFGAAFGNSTFSGTINDGSSPVRVVKANNSSVTLSGLNTYTGTTTTDNLSTLSVTNLANIGQPSALGRGNGASVASNAASFVFTGVNSTSAAAGGLSYIGSSSISIDRLFTFGGTTAPAGGTLQANGANNATLIFNNFNPIAYTAAASSMTQNLRLAGSSTGDNRIDLRLVNPGSAVLNIHKEGAGTWVLGNASNTYTGLTTISNGRLLAVDGFSLPAASPLVLRGGALLVTSGNFTRPVIASPTAGSGGVNWLGSGGFAASDAKLTVNLGNGANLTWDSGGFLSIGASTVAAGVLVLNSTRSLFETEFKNNINLGAVARTVQVDDNTSTSLDYATLSGVISGTNGLIKTGAGTLYLVGANTHSGTTLSNGQLFVTSFGGSASSSSSLGNGQGGVQLDGGSLNYVGEGETSNRPVILGGSTAIDSSGYGALVLSDIEDFGLGAVTLTLQGTNTDANEIGSELGSSGPNALSLTKGGGGTWILSGNNFYTGTTSLLNGNLGIGHSNALGFGPFTWSNGSLFAQGSDRTIAKSFSITGGAQAGVIGIHSLTVNGNGTFSNGGNTTLINNLAPEEKFEITGTFSNADTTTARTFILAGSGRTVLSGVVSDGLSSNARATALTNNSGTLVLGSSSANTYSGNTTIGGGTVQLAGSSGDAIPDGAGKGNVIFTPTTRPATLDLNGRSETINGLSGISSGAASIDNSAAIAATLIVGGNDQGGIFNGSITNSGGGPLSLVKTGAGTIELTRVSTHTGGTTVNAGTLLISGSIVGLVNVNGGTLGGIGSVGAIHANGGTIAPGASLGTLVAESLTMQAGSEFALEISPTTLANDQLVTLNDFLLELAASATLSIRVVNGDTALPLGTKFTFITYGGTWNGGLFAVAGNPISDDLEYFQVGANVFALDYNDGGQSVSLIAVPEPAGAASLLGGIGLLAGLRRRR